MFEKGEYLHDNFDKQKNKTQNNTNTKQTVL